MSRTTWEEARACPRCGNPGEETKRESGPKGSTVYVLTCRTERCKWENTGWLVQVNRDGSIPERQKGDKDFTPYTETQKQHARDVQRFNQQIMEHGEIRQ